MTQLKSLGDLRELRERIVGAKQHDKPTVIVCGGTACQASECSRLIRSAKKYILMNDLLEKVDLRVTGCHGFCEMGPFVLTEPQRAFYTKIHHYHVPRIIAALLNNEYVDELIYRDPVTGDPCRDHNEIPFFKKQRRALLGKNQALDPIRLANYLSVGGYRALESVLERSDRDWVIAQIEDSKLRGRGGAGFSTGTKWRLAREQDGSNCKYVVCNADEGDPGAYMDRSILEGNPHSVLEGMVIGGIAIGATEGFVFVRHEYPQAIKHTLIALRSARDHGLLGKNILGTGIDFDIHIVKSAGAFVCGEETALIKTIEGTIGEPRQRPPYPIVRGIHGRPTCINNVETWANVPLIIDTGAAAYARVGTTGSTGTKVFSVVGKIKNTGLVEVPMGTPINDIVYDVCGGPKDGGEIKAVQIGGPAGGCIPHARFNLPIDYDSLRDAGAMMGSGGMIVMDQGTCMVDVAKYFMGFLQDESCGKCFTCRKGTQRMHELLDDITRGEGTMEKLALLEELAEAVKDTTMCGLGQSAPNPVLSTLRYYRNEYERHIIDKRCDAFVCKELVGAPCQSGCPVGTEVWRYVAHISAGEYNEAYAAIRESNPFPSVCARVCDHKCEQRCRLGTSGEDPLAIRALKRFVTDRVDPAAYQPRRAVQMHEERIAVVGAGPAGLTAAHLLSLRGYRCTIFDSNAQPGGMLATAIPTYRLPREVVEREIDALLDHNIALEMGKTLGRDFSVDDLFGDGYGAVFLSLGATKSQTLGIAGNNGTDGVYSSMAFLSEFNIHGRELATGRVGVVGGGNSAIDAARVALRQQGVEQVTVIYRRTRDEMPAFKEEVDAALREGICLDTLVAPTKLVCDGGVVQGVECVKTTLGERDSSGRRRPRPVSGSEFVMPLDTLIVAIGELPDTSCLKDGDGGADSIETASWGGINVHRTTLSTHRPGVFAGGDAVSGPNTVIDAIAAGKHAATSIDRYLRGRPLELPKQPGRPSQYVASHGGNGGDDGESARTLARLTVPHLDPQRSTASFEEVEGVVGEEDAVRESRRCLRCDLEFATTADPTVAAPCVSTAGGRR